MASTRTVVYPVIRPAALVVGVLLLSGGALSAQTSRTPVVTGVAAHGLSAASASGAAASFALRPLGVLSPRVGALVLEGESARVGAGVLGAGVSIGFGRLRLRPSAEVAYGRLQVAVDSGGYHTVDGGYRPFRRPVESWRAGAGGAIGVGWAFSPSVTLEATAGYRAFGRPEGAEAMGRGYGGLGLRYTFAGAAPAPTVDGRALLARRARADETAVVPPPPVLERVPEPEPDLEPEPEPESEPARTGALAGQIVPGLDGTALPEGVRVAVQDRAAGERVVEVSASDDGAFRLPSLPEGEYEVVVTAEGYASVTYHGAVVRADQARSLPPIPMVPATDAPASMAGRVVIGEEARPLEGARVELLAGLGALDREPVAVVVTDARGGYTFDQVAAGVYTVYIRDEGRIGAAIVAVAVGGEETATLPLARLTRGGDR